MVLPWHLYLMASLYFMAGLNHFRVPGVYIRMIPSSLPNPKMLNLISGTAEVILAILLCIPVFKSFAAWGIIALLIAIFPANVFMLTDKKASLGIPKWILFVRLPLQLVLIYWAYCYT